MHAIFLLAFLLLASCASVPSGPSVMVLPGDNKSFDEFRSDDSVCRQFARQQTGNRTPDIAAAGSGAATAATGAILGAAAGAAGGQGAGRGASAGLALGGLSGLAAGRTSASILQQRYDIGYQQCMYAKGHRIPAASNPWNDFFYQPGNRYFSRPSSPGADRPR